MLEKHRVCFETKTNKKPLSMCHWKQTPTALIRKVVGKNLCSWCIRWRWRQYQLVLWAGNSWEGERDVLFGLWFGCVVQIAAPQTEIYTPLVSWVLDRLPNLNFAGSSSKRGHQKSLLRSSRGKCPVGFFKFGGFLGGSALHNAKASLTSLCVFFLWWKPVKSWCNCVDSHVCIVCIWFFDTVVFLIIYRHNTYVNICSYLHFMHALYMFVFVPTYIFA